MSQEFFDMIEEKLTTASVTKKWTQKTVNFFENFSYLNSEILIEDQVEKLTHIGVNSIGQSGQLIQGITTETLNMIDQQLKTIIKDVADLTIKFDSLDKVLKQKQGFFSSKKPSEAFFEMFQEEQKMIRQQINELNLKEHDLYAVKENLEHNVEKLIDSYVLLDRDLHLLKSAEEKLSKSSNPLIVKIFNKYLFEITGIKTDLLTHQQIIFQKYAGLKILLKNVFNCHKNIKYISQVTHNVIMNIAELQQIISLSQSTMSNKETDSLKKLKETLTLATTDLKLIAAQPFNAYA